MKPTRLICLLFITITSTFCYANDLLKYCNPDNYSAPEYSDPKTWEPTSKYEKLNLNDPPIRLTIEQFAGVIPFHLSSKGSFANFKMEVEVIGYCNDPYFAKLKYYHGNGYAGIIYIREDAQSFPISYPEFKNSPLEFIDIGYTESLNGRIRFQRFASSGGLSCVTFDHTLWDKRNINTIHTEGYYCNRSGKILSDEEINSFFAGLIINGFN